MNRKNPNGTPKDAAGAALNRSDIIDDEDIKDEQVNIQDDVQSPGKYLDNNSNLVRF